MKWSYKVARIFGIDIRLHLIFIMLLVVIALQITASEGVATGLWATMLVSLVFFFVLLHELGHSLVARKHGVRIQDIILLPIGGMARLSHIPEDPNTELKIAIAGPAVNLAIAALLLPLAIFFSFFLEEAEPLEPSFHPASIFAHLIALNMMLALFNFLPAFPMDGGRILRAFLAKFTTYVRATAIAARVGKVLAIAMLIVGFQFKPPHFGLILIAIFIYFVGGKEEQAVRLRHMYKTRHLPRPPLEIYGKVDEDFDFGDQNLTPEQERARAFEELARRLDEMRRKDGY